MANFKLKSTYIAEDAVHFPNNITDPAIRSIIDARNEPIRVLIQAFDNNDSPNTVPVRIPAEQTTLDDGRVQLVTGWTGFESQAEAVTFAQHAVKQAAGQADLVAYWIANNVRCKIAVTDDNNNEIQVLQDNTHLDRHTVNGYVENPDDPFFVEA